MAFGQDAVGERVGHHAFVVVRDHQRIQFPERRFDPADEAFFDGACQRLAAFAVHAHDLLVPRHDARFDGGDARGVGDDSLRVHSLFFQK